MRARDIELWALQVINRLKNNQPVEDSRVELKADWPTDVTRAARRIAGHANAARGEDILWLIGVDEKQRRITGAMPTELATWWPQVKAQFDELPPDLADVVVPADGATLVALKFGTDRAPYVGCVCKIW